MSNELLEEYQVEKTGWPDGPWMTEPDRVSWRTKAGLPGLAVRNHFGAWCGYAAVSPGHPDYEKDYDAVPVEVHGGLTYAEHCQGHICHVPEPGESEEAWWLGLDCCHAWDYSPGLEATVASAAGRAMRFPGADLLGNGLFHETYRDLTYIQGEVESLAQQLADRAPKKHKTKRLTE